MDEWTLIINDINGENHKPTCQDLKIIFGLIAQGYCEGEIDGDNTSRLFWQVSETLDD